jgi:ketosteroid isomerase-like protein
MRDDDEMNDVAACLRESGALSRRQFGALTVAAGVASVLPAVAPAAQTKAPVSGPAAGRNVEILRRFIERGFNQGDLTVADEIGAQKYQEHEYLMPTDLGGPETLKTGIREARKAVRDLKMTIEDIAVSGDRVWARMLLRGFDAASGKPIEMTVMDISRFENGKLVEHWGVPDRFALLHQLGLLPPGVA